MRLITDDVPIPATTPRRGAARVRAIRLLLHKEWAEQRSVLWSGLALLAVVPIMIALAATSVAHTGSLQAAAELTSRAAPFVIWPLIALAAGALTVAGDAGDTGRLGFVLSRPASRSDIWAAKVTVGATTLVVVMLATDLLGRALAWLDGSPPFTLLRLADGLPSSSTDAHLVFVALPAVVWLYFACAVFLSTWLPRPLIVTLLGAVIASLVYALILATWWGIDLFPRLTGARMAWGPLTAAGLVLAAAAWTFDRGELLRGSRARLHAAGAGVVALATMGGVLGAAGLHEARAPGPDAIFNQLHRSPDGRLLVTASRSDGGSRTVWVSDPEARRFEHALPRLTDHAVASPDGRWIAYASSRGLAGRRARHARVHVARPDGSEDRVVLDGLRTPRVALGIVGNADRRILARFQALHFSADGRWLAVQQEGMLYAVDLRDGTSTERQLASGCGLLGWNADVRMLVHCRWEPPRLLFLAPHPEDGSDRQVGLFDYRRPGTRSASPWDLRMLTFVGAERPTGTQPNSGQGRLYGLDANTGRLDRFASVKVGTPTAAGGGLVAWASHDRERRTSSVWITRPGEPPQHLERMTDGVRGLWIHPDSRWLIVRHRQPRAPRDVPPTTTVLSLTDDRRFTLPTEPVTWSSSWYPVWLEDDRIAYLSGYRFAGGGLGEAGYLRNRAFSVRVHDLATDQGWTVEPLR